jgi:hypothetical protein
MAVSSALLTNNASSTLAGSLTNVATSFSVAAGEGARFPNPGASEYFYVTLSNTAGSSIEIVKCTARATDVFTIVRGQDGTTGTAFNASDIVELRPIAALFREKVDGPSASTDNAIARFDATTGKILQDSVVLISDTGVFTLPLAATPAAAAADKLNLFTRKRGGRMMTTQMGPSGLDTSLQPHNATNAISKWVAAGNSTTIVADGAAALIITGTATAANVATTNRHTYMKRIEALVTVAATTAVAGWRGAAALFGVGGAAAGDGGFHFICRFGPATGVATTTHRLFVGMANTTAAPTDVEPSTITNIVGVGYDAADTNMQIMHRGTGAITKIDLGASFPVPTADRTKVYELVLFSKPGTTQEVGYEVTDLATGAVASGTITTNMPTTATLLAPRLWMSVGGTSSVIGIALMGLYIETDY